MQFQDFGQFMMNHVRFIMDHRRAKCLIHLEYSNIVNRIIDQGRLVVNYMFIRFRFMVMITKNLEYFMQQ